MTRHSADCKPLRARPEPIGAIVRGSAGQAIGHVLRRGGAVEAYGHAGCGIGCFGSEREAREAISAKWRAGR